MSLITEEMVETGLAFFREEKRKQREAVRRQNQEFDLVRIERERLEQQQKSDYKRQVQDGIRRAIADGAIPGSIKNYSVSLLQGDGQSWVIRIKTNLIDPTTVAEFIAMLDAGIQPEETTMQVALVPYMPAHYGLDVHGTRRKERIKP